LSIAVIEPNFLTRFCITMTGSLIHPPFRSNESFISLFS
jgi:hypothetical protein